MLADESIRGARESGNDVTVFDVFRADIRPYRMRTLRNKRAVRTE